MKKPFIFNMLTALMPLFFLCSSAFALEPADKWEGAIDYKVTGGSFLEDTCSVSLIGCQPGVFDGHGDSVTTTSSGLMADIPQNAKIVSAYLSWMGSLKHPIDEVDDEVFLRPPSGSTHRIKVDPNSAKNIIFEEENVNQQMADFHYYTFRVNVTDILKDHQNSGKPINGEFTVSEFYAYADEPYKLKTLALGGWSLFIVYFDPQGTNKNIYYYTDFAKIGDDVLLLKPSGFDVAKDSDAKVTFFIGEGDHNISGQGSAGTHSEALKVNNYLMTDPCNPSDNVFNSTINTIRETGGSCRNEMSIDLDTFDISNTINEGDTSLDVTLSVGQDRIFTNYILIAIETEEVSFDIPAVKEKISSISEDETVEPGQEIIYGITVQYQGEGSVNNVRVKDTLSQYVSYVSDSTKIIAPNGLLTPVQDPSDGKAPVENGVKIADILPSGDASKYIVEFTVRVNSEALGVKNGSVIENVAEILYGNGGHFFTNGGIPVRHVVKVKEKDGSILFETSANQVEKLYALPSESQITIGSLFVSTKDNEQELRSLTFAPAAGSNTQVIHQAALAWDHNHNGKLDNSDVLISNYQNWQNNGITFSSFGDLSPLKKDVKETIYVIADIAPYAVTGQQCQLVLLEQNVVSSGETEGLPLKLSTVIVPELSTDITVEVGPQNPPSSTLRPDSDSTVFQIRLRAYTPDISIDEIIFAAEGNLDDENAIDGIRIAVDNNRNGIFDSNDVEIGKRQKFSEDNGIVTFSDLKLAIAKFSEVSIVAIVELGKSAENGDTFKLVIERDSYIDANGKDITGAPIKSNEFTISTEEVQCTKDEDCQSKLGDSWTCDTDRHICTKSASTDGDADDENSGETPEFVQLSGGCAGCNSSDQTAIYWFLSIFMIIFIIRRKHLDKSLP